MLSQKARYALHAVVVLGCHDGEAPMRIADIASEARVPPKFLEQILVDLKKRGIVRSQRGRTGGYHLGRPAAEISFADIIREIDGPLALSPCASVTAYRKCDDCLDEASCAIRKALLAARDAIAASLESSNLADAVTEARHAGWA
jgi:Rrf2 family protein